jgi:pimeloyl-ACP methyl ester carboxylesterase
LARKFLYVVVFLIVLTIAGALAYRLAGVRIIRWWAVPSARFEPLPGVDADAYTATAMWIARPDLPGNPALWTPAGYAPGAKPQAAVFFIHPTSFLGTARWNAALDDAETNARAALFLRGQASAFNEIGAIWAPRYRQATFGAFLTNADAANQALDLAYRDVAAAFEAFLRQAGDRPIILAGHSQGALHLTRLLREKVAKDARLRKRIVAAYVVGWPVSRTTDLASMGVPECRTVAQTNCLLSWQSFAAPADPSLIVDTFDATTGFDGRARKGTPMVCTNPLTGTADGSAPASANLGTLFPSSDLTSATIAAAKVGAKCDGRGFLLLDNAIELGPYLLPGNNYHVYDYSLFWANVRKDAARRLAGFTGPAS